MTHVEALVLLEMFADFRNEVSVPVRDQAERRALWNLVCNIEKVLPEVSVRITPSVL
jgi:phosphoribosylaminoimidazole carboxylase (NCAIR synthetase)